MCVRAGANAQEVIDDGRKGHTHVYLYIHSRIHTCIQELSESLVGGGGRKRRRMFSRADLAEMGLKPDDLRADDYIKVRVCACMHVCVHVVHACVHDLRADDYIKATECMCIQCTLICIYMHPMAC